MDNRSINTANLLALRVVVVELDASAGGAGGAAREADTTALLPLLRRSAASRRRSRDRSRARGRSGGGGSGRRSDGADWGVAASGAVAGDGRAGDGVLADAGPDVDTDTGVGARVGTWELDDGGRRSTGATRDVELDAAHVELSTRVVGGGVESNDLATEEVVARGDVGGKLNVPLAVLSLAELVDSPDTVVETLLLDLEPVQAGNISSSGRVVDLGKVGNDGTLVGLSNWVYDIVSPRMKMTEEDIYHHRPSADG